jgi:hypothetical protein
MLRYCSCVVAAQDSGKVYKSCEAIGEGFGGEVWKARHKNITVLEQENGAVQLLMTKLRNAETESECGAAAAALTRVSVLHGCVAVAAVDAPRAPQAPISRSTRIACSAFSSKWRFRPCPQPMW